VKKAQASIKRTLIYIIDALLILEACCVIYMVLPSERRPLLERFFPYVVLMIAVTFLCREVIKIYKSIWKYSDTYVFMKICVSDFVACFFAAVLSELVLKIDVHAYFIICTYMLGCLFTLASRFLYRSLREYKIFKERPSNVIHIAIVGAGKSGTTLANEILATRKCKYIPYCFFDDDESKKNKYIHNIKVMGTAKDIPAVLKNSRVKEIFIAIPNLDIEKRNELIEICSQTNCDIKIYEHSFDKSSLSSQNEKKGFEGKLRDINIEDLLCRNSVSLELNIAKQLIVDKVVMVTGGGGSIGSELCRQIIAMQPKKLIVLDIYENNAYDLQQELLRKGYSNDVLYVEIASVRDKEKIDRIFEKYKPQIVFHAAAHKHVPLMENCGDEAIKNNVFGTYNVANAAEKYSCDIMILISTDKAVNPTNIMGATKRLCEMIIQSKKSQKTKFAAVRFGNVLGSNGSVVPLFKKQIEHGGPVTITDKRIIRYFMTISEAANLVLQAATLANNGEVFVLDMGEPVKILDLAEKMIMLSGYRPYTDIDIVETGLRKGEKLYEELLVNSDTLTKTFNDKIFIEQKMIDDVDIQEVISKLEKCSHVLEHDEIIEIIKETVPTYKTPEETNKEYISSK